MANRLINESSPYLLQHAHNPVDWYPWGPEALERAKAEDKPILLSVGYSACHWCHVMERESFENEDIAALMNESFVCIKVDREERPDIDSIYMTAVQIMTGQGGWPMTVFLTPDGRPFFGGTYFPPQDLGSMAGFPKVLSVVAKHYRENRSEVLLTTDRLFRQIQQMSLGVRGIEPLTDELLNQARRGMAEQFDYDYGGVGTQPKFPQPMTYEFLLRYHLRTGDSKALDMVELTLERMAHGGIYDQIGGGFHRYSTDMFWLVPHFEKMLYDNALLAKLYLHTYQATGKALYRRIVEETLDYVLREMTDESGGFYSAQDADSEGVEGKFFIWLQDEIIDVLGKENGEVINRYFGVTNHGNFEGRNILSVSGDAAEVRQNVGMTEGEFDEFMSRCKARLLEVRDGRIRPERDEKILTSWNGLMLRAFAQASAVLGRPDYARVAERNAAFLLDNLRDGERLLRTYKDSGVKLRGYLEDYAFLIDGLIALHEATLDARWLNEAIGLGTAMVDLFWDGASAQFYDTGRDHEELIIRPRDITDNAIPAGSSMAVDVLLRLAVITGDDGFRSHALTAMRSLRELMVQSPTGFGHWLCALDFYLSNVKEVAIVGDPRDRGTEALLAEVHRQFIPNHVLIGRSDGDDDLAGLPLMQGRERLNGRSTAYVCQNYVCQLPVNEPEALSEQLAE